MKRLLYLFFFLALCSFSFIKREAVFFAGVTYYISDVNPNAGNSGTSEGAPWTFAKMKSSMATFQAGDRVLLHRGESFFGTLPITKTGTSTAQLTFGAYGTAPEKPEITSFMNVTFPAQNPADHIYISSTNAAFPAGRIKLVQSEDTLCPIGRYPDVNTTNKGWLNIDKETGGALTAQTAQISELNSATQSWVNAEFVYRNTKWTFYNVDITAHSGSTISFMGDIGAAVDTGWGGFIQNHPKTLTQPGEWYYDSTGKKLYMYSLTQPTNVKIPTIDLGISIGSAYDYITLDNLSVTGFNGNAIDLLNSDNSTVSNCDATFAGFAGISAGGNSGSSHIHDVLISGCRTDWTFMSGIAMRNADNMIVENCYVTNNDMIRGMGAENIGTNYRGVAEGGSGIGATDGAIIRNNRIENTGYVGIRIPEVTGLIENNYIFNSCAIKEDAGAIYNQQATPRSNSRPVANPGNPTIIRNNVINTVGEGSIEGTPNWPGFTNPATGSAGNGISAAHGIYFDDRMNDIQAYGNTVYNARGGSFYGHNTFNIELSDNDFYYMGNAGNVRLQSDGGTNPTHRNIDIHDNRLITLTGASQVYQFIASLHDVALWGTINNNILGRPAADINESAAASSSNRLMSADGTDYTLTTWRTKYKWDLASTKPAAVPSTSYYVYYDNPTFAPKTITATETYRDFRSLVSFLTGQISFPSMGAMVLVKTPGVALNFLQKYRTNRAFRQVRVVKE